jgi:hypothetical protein
MAGATIINKANIQTNDFSTSFPQTLVDQTILQEDYSGCIGIVQMLSRACSKKKAGDCAPAFIIGSKR